MYEDDNDDGIIGTALPGTYPDEILSFSAGAEDGPDRPEGDDDEPWDEFDEQAIGELEDVAVSFGGPALEDDSSYERWLQSALKALVVHDLDVDGELGPRTRLAVKTFQRRAGELRAGAPKLTADGVVGPRTIAELELQTQSKAPSKQEGDDAEVRVVAVEPTSAVAAPTQQADTG